MEDNNQENLQSTDQSTEVVQPPVEEVQDPRLIHPIIIGELRKEKIGKPVMVIELFLLFGIVFAALPFINSMMTDENSFLYKLIHPGTVSSTVVADNNPGNTKEEYLDGSKLNLLSEGKIKFKNIILQKISLSDGKVKCTISSYSGTVNLDEGNYYLQISAGSGDIISAVKLTGSIDIVEKEVIFEVFDFKYNGSVAYQGKIVEMKESEYPKYTLSGVDERGYASLVCTKGGRTITYGFRNDFLEEINDNNTVNNSSLSDDEYINSLDSARKKANALGIAVANVEENETGYVYTASIKLENYTIPDTVVDYDYYPFNTKVEKIAYAQKGKGYDCK